MSASDNVVVIIWSRTGSARVPPPPPAFRDQNQVVAVLLARSNVSLVHVPNRRSGRSRPLGPARYVSSHTAEVGLALLPPTPTSLTCPVLHRPPPPPLTTRPPLPPNPTRPP